MKRISENTKVTLTIGQLRKLIAESKFMMNAIDSLKEDDAFRRRVVDLIFRDLVPGDDFEVTDNGGGALEVNVPGSVQIDQLRRAVRRKFRRSGAWILFNRAYRGMASVDFYADGDLAFTVTGPDAEIKDNGEDSYELAAYQTIDR